MILQLKNIGKSFGGDEIVSNVNMKIEQGEKVGLIGVNGAGKSTIMNIIAGNISHDEGEVVFGKKLKVGYLKQMNALNPENTVEEEMKSVFDSIFIMERQLKVLEEKMALYSKDKDDKNLNKVMKSYGNKLEEFESSGGYEIESKVKYIMNGMGFAALPKGLKIEKLSGGQKTRLAMAKILLGEPELLLLDEPTNHLDVDSLEWFEKYIKNYRGAVILISHDRFLLDVLADTIYEIERGRCRRYKGNYSEYLRQKNENIKIHDRDYKVQQKYIKKLEMYIQKNMARASTSKQAKSRLKALNKIDRIDRPEKELKGMNVKFQTGSKSFIEVLNVKNAVVSVGEGDKKVDLIKNLKLKVMRGDKIAITGPNGIGKTTMLRGITGESSFRSGQIKWGQGVNMGYYDQEHSNLEGENTIFEELRREYPSTSETEIRRILGHFLFTKEDVFKLVKELSGGEKARVALSKMMLKKVNFMILDEPTNHLDLKSREILEKALLNYEGSILFVSHDRYFINHVANRVIKLTHDGSEIVQDDYDCMISG